MITDSSLSKTIAWLRFPLIVLVVFIHTGAENIANFPAANFLYEDVFRETITRVAVPLFFFISGFLYFYKTEWNRAAYIKKVRSRLKTIAVPYCVWSMLAVLYSVLVYKCGLTRNTAYADYTLSDWLVPIYASFDADPSKSGLIFPLIAPFWFIRDLFVVGLLSPIWHWFLKRKFTGLLFLCAIVALWFCYRGPQIPGLSTTAICFFCAGAYFSIHGRDFTEDFSKLGIGATLLYVPALLANALFGGETGSLNSIFIIISIVAIVFWVRKGIESGKLKEISFLSAATFMVYAGHGVVFFMSPVERVLDLFVPVPSNGAGIVAFLVAMAAFKIAFWLGVYWCVRKWFPWSLPFLTGGR